MRLFVAVWPTPDVATALARLPRPALPSVRWTSPQQLHVTLRFLGEVDEPAATTVTDALRAMAAEQPRVDALLAETARRLGPRTVVLPVTGIDVLVESVIDATRHVGRPVERRPFQAHLTVARLRPGHPRLPGAIRLEGPTAWPVDAVALVRSHQRAGGVEYETLASLALAG